LRGTPVGKQTRMRANALVVEDVPAKALIVGVPIELVSAKELMLP